MNKNYKKDKNKDENEQYCYRNKLTNIVQICKPTGNVYIHEAAFVGNLAFINLYIEYNGNINAVDSNGKNALHLCCMCDNEEVCKFLLLNGINVNLKEKINGQTPLHVAIKYRSYSCLKYLIKFKCNINEVE